MDSPWGISSLDVSFDEDDMEGSCEDLKGVGIDVTGESICLWGYETFLDIGAQFW